MSNETMTGCHLCGKDAELKDATHPGYQEPDTFAIYQCTHCNTAFALPMVDAAQVYENIYKNGPAVPGYDRYWKYMAGAKAARNPLQYLAGEEDIYWSVKEALNKVVTDKGNTRILEVGSGLGYLTYALNTAGYAATGMDISQTAVSQAIRTFGNYYLCADLFKYAALHAGSFDVVILTEVIEHVREPVLFINAVLQLLKPGGHAIVTTPNRSLFPAEVTWRTENPPVHYWWLGEESMQFIAGKSNVQLEFINFTNFYKDHYTSFNLRQCSKNIPLRPILDTNGNVAVPLNKPGILQRLPRLIVSKFPALRKTLAAMKKNAQREKEKNDSGMIVCGERGNVLCAIFQK